MEEHLFCGKCNEVGKYNGQWIEGFYAFDDEMPVRRGLSRVFSTKVVVFFSYKTTKALIHFPERKLYQRFHKIII